MSTMLIAFSGTRENGQFLGDQICSVKAAWAFAQNTPCGKYILALSPQNDMNFLWQKFIDTYHCEIVYDTFSPGNMDERFDAWDRWRRSREIEGRKFDVYKELYRRIDGGRRQGVLCGAERGLGRKNIFEYFYYGQEHVKEPPVGLEDFDDTLIYHPLVPSERAVLIAPYAKCQGNMLFSFEYWERVCKKLIDAGITVTVNHHGPFADGLTNHPLFRKIFPSPPALLDEVCRHKLVACGNTGVGWLAGACGVPLLAMQPVNSNMQDYRYELCGVKSMVEFLDQPDADYCARRIAEEVNSTVVFTTGCYDVLHAGHIRHLEESRALGTRLIVGLNSDESVKRLKGEGRPLNPQDQRSAVLRALRYVDDVRVFNGDDATELIHEIRPAIITNGCDHKADEIVGKDFVEKYGGRVAVTSGTRTSSSTRLIAKLVRASDVLKAVNDASAISPNPYGKLKLLADQFLSVNSIPGDIADLGAYRGGCSLILRRLAPEKDLHVFDTFAGNPYNDPLCHHRKGEWVATLEETQRHVGTDKLTHYHIGVFPDTAAKLTGRMFCFVVVDMDTYQATRDAIEWFWPRMVVGGKMYFDDVPWEPCAGAEKAVNEAFQPNQQERFPNANACVVTKK